MPRALMAKLHSWFSVNSRRCCSFITPCTVSRVISGDIGVLFTGRILPLTFIEGGTPAVMNRSEPPFSTIRRNSFSNSIVVLAVLAKPLEGAAGSYRLLKVFRLLGLFLGAVTRDQALG